MEKLACRRDDAGSLLCVGLDTDQSRVPGCLKEKGHPVFAFNKEIIDATADLACAYKLQIAYYSAQGTENDLIMTVNYLRAALPEMPVILDAKRGDIGSTAKMYAREVFDRYKADAVTVNPYMGGDALAPFLDRKDKGVFILCRTSNPGAGDLQDLETSGRPLYQAVAEKAAWEWNYNRNAGLVMGATYPDELARVRGIAGDMPLLVPGVGAQGGDLEAVMKNGLDSKGAGLLIHSSRSIIYAGGGEDFAPAARRAAEALRGAVNRWR